MKPAVVLLALAGVFAFGAAVGIARGEVVVFSDRDEWAAEVGSFTTIGFVFETKTYVDDQFADLGVVFTGPAAAIPIGSSSDGWVLTGDPIAMEFSQPMTWVAVDFLGVAQFDLFADDDLLYSSPYFDDSFSPFAGLVSDQPFDAVRINGLTGVTIDDLYFGPSIPAPATWLLAVAAAPAMRRRRR